MTRELRQSLFFYVGCFSMLPHSSRPSAAVGAAVSGVEGIDRHRDSGKMENRI